MAKQRPKRSSPQRDTKAARSDAPAHPRPAFSRQKLWLFRLLALISSPVLFVVVLELESRIGGYGYPSLTEYCGETPRMNSPQDTRNDCGRRRVFCSNLKMRLLSRSRRSLS